MRYIVAIIYNAITAFMSFFLIMFLGIISPALGIPFYLAFQAFNIEPTTEQFSVIFKVTFVVITVLVFIILTLINIGIFKALNRDKKTNRIIFTILASLPHAVIIGYILQENIDYILGS